MSKDPCSPGDRYTYARPQGSLGTTPPLRYGPFQVVAPPRRIAARIQIIEIERAAEAFNLDFRRLHLGFAQVIDHARADQRHDQADDGDDDQNFDQREAAFVAARPPADPTGGNSQASHTSSPRRMRLDFIRRFG